MKKIALFSLSMLMLASTVQPALAVLTEADFKEASWHLRARGFLAGLATGTITGLATGGALQQWEERNAALARGWEPNDLPATIRHQRAVAAGTTIGLAGCNLIVPQYINRYFLATPRNFLKSTLKLGGESFEGKIIRERISTTAQNKELKKIMENTAFWTDAVVTSGLISGLASGPVRTLVAPGAPESNSFKNFCVTLPFVFAGVTALKYGSYKLHKYMHGKPKVKSN